MYVCMMHVCMLHICKIHIHMMHIAFILDPKASIHDASTFDVHICIYMHICMNDAGTYDACVPVCMINVCRM